MKHTDDIIHMLKRYENNDDDHQMQVQDTDMKKTTIKERLLLIFGCLLDLNHVEACTRYMDKLSHTVPFRNKDWLKHLVANSASTSRPSRHHQGRACRGIVSTGS